MSGEPAGGPEGGGVFRTSSLVRFAHCDPAGIAFYPRLFELVNGVVEDWFAQGLGCSFDRLHRERGLGAPTVTLTAQFHAPARLGETLDFALRAAVVGGASIDLVVDATVADAPRFTVRPRLVLTTLGEPMRAAPLPDDLRPAVLRFLEPAA